METRSAVKVGIVAVMGLALLVALWAFLSHLSVGRYTLDVVFEDTKGLVPQTQVLMNGKPIGEVRRVELRPSDLRPVVTLAIEKKYRIPANARIQITSGILITNPQVLIYLPEPPSTQSLTGPEWPSALVDARPASALAQMSPEASAAVAKLTATMETLTPKLTASLDQVQGILQRTDRMMANFERASDSMRTLVADPKIRRTVQKTLDDFSAVSTELSRTTVTLSSELRGLVGRNSGKLDEMVNGALDLLLNLKDTLDAARAMVTRLAEQASDPRLQQVLQETLDLAKTTIARFNQIASDIQQITGDAEVQSNLKATAEKVREASEKGQEIATRVGAMMDRLSLPKVDRPFGLGEPSVGIDFLLRDGRPRFRSDVRLSVPIKQSNRLELGLYDFADRNKLVAQYGTDVGLGLFRYGIYASKLGAGLDLGLGARSSLQLDLYDPNRLQFDVRALVDLNKDFALWVGADSLFRKSTPMIGMRLKR